MTLAGAPKNRLGKPSSFRTKRGYSRIKGTNRTDSTVLVLIVPSACFVNTVSS
jgi:hypothetical protein